MAAKKFTRLTGAMQASALQHAEPDRLFGGSRQGMRLVEPRIEDIDLNPNQPRRHFDAEALQTLTDSIEQHGQKQPIGVQMQENGRWLLVFGERRFRACHQLGLATVQAVVTDGDPLEIALIENLQREDLSLFETADAFARLMDKQGYNRSTLARVVGTTPSAITRLMGLRKLPISVRREYETKHPDIAKSLLLELVDIGDEKTQQAAWAAVKSGVTVRELRDLRQSGDLVATAAGQGESKPDQMSEKGLPKPRIDPLFGATVRLEKLITPYQNDRTRLDDEHKTRLKALRDMIDGLLSE
jgi:ParB family transcriptional regulator, chromosome partitioning protein